MPHTGPKLHVLFCGCNCDEFTTTTTTTPWSRVLPEKLKRPKLLKKFPAFYGTRRFITAPVPILSQIDPVHAPIQPLEDLF
jgi:hypothetical protein